MALVAMDLVWALGVVGLASIAWLAGGAVGGALGVLVGLLTWLATATFILWLLPKPRPGLHTMMRGRDFWCWSFTFIARRWLELPPINMLWRHSNVLRFVVLRAAGARFAFGAQMSSDVTLLDPGLLVMGKGAMLGSQSTVAGHFIVGDKLLLAPVVIEARAQVALGVVIGPGAFIGEGALVEARANVAHEARVGARAVIGPLATVGRGAVVGVGAKVAMGATVPPFTQVPDGTQWPSAV